jgi:hypothetical protein
LQYVCHESEGKNGLRLGEGRQFNMLMQSPSTHQRPSFPLRLLILLPHWRTDKIYGEHAAVTTEPTRIHVGETRGAAPPLTCRAGHCDAVDNSLETLKLWQRTRRRADGEWDGSRGEA